MKGNKATGDAYEQLACKYLTSHGYRIVERNYRCKTGEIDVIAKEGGYLVFVEVKYRRHGRTGDPVEAVDLKKQRKICLTAAFYMMCAGMHQDDPIRFDVVSILGDEIRIYRNAFPYCLT